MSLQRPVNVPEPAMSSASASPISAIGITASERVDGRAPPAAHEISVSSIGCTLNTSSASAAGMRATDEYRQ